MTSGLAAGAVVEVGAVGGGTRARRVVALAVVLEAAGLVVDGAFAFAAPPLAKRVRRPGRARCVNAVRTKGG